MKAVVMTKVTTMKRQKRIYGYSYWGMIYLHRLPSQSRRRRRHPTTMVRIVRMIIPQCSLL